MHLVVERVYKLEQINTVYNGKEIQNELEEQYDYGAWTPYHYGFNNPVKNTDPDGKIPVPVVGAIIGGLVDIAIQSAEIGLTDKTFSTDFSWKSVGVSTVAGATGVGLASKIGKLGIVAKIGIELAHDAAAGAINQYAAAGKVDAKTTMANAIGGKIVADAVRGIVSKKIASSPEAKRLAKVARRESNNASNNPSQGRINKAKLATQQAENYQKTKAIATDSSSSGAIAKFMDLLVNKEKEKK